MFFIKILLGYLSQDINEWDNLLNEKRKLYQQFVSELIVSDNSNVQSPDDHVSLVNLKKKMINYFDEMIYYFSHWALRQPVTGVLIFVIMKFCLKFTKMWNASILTYHFFNKELPKNLIQIQQLVMWLVNWLIIENILLIKNILLILL